jgi:hypothetical protein
VDLQDADQLESRIQEERQQLAYLFQDLKEQESLLEFHQKLQEDLLRKRHAERIAQLQNYRKLKSSEAEVESLIRPVKGFVSYSLFRTADGGASVTVCADKAGTDESIQKARDWIGKNASGLGVNPPTVIEGPVILQLK